MTIQYCSDLHLEFGHNKAYLQAHPLKPVGEVLLLAGDVVPFALMEKHAWFFDFVSDHFATTYWVPGNHEYYHGTIDEGCRPQHERIRENVFLVNNTAATHGDVKFIFSTLWSAISPAYALDIQQRMSDFEVIKCGTRQLTPHSFNRLHDICRTFIEGEPKQPHAGKTMVVTHHVPTLMNYPARYQGDVLNEAFAVELHDLMAEEDIAYWLYGHHHQDIPEFEIAGTKLITNQLGYVAYGEDAGFVGDRVLVL